MLFFVLCSQLGGNGTIKIKNVLICVQKPLVQNAVLYTYIFTKIHFLTLLPQEWKVALALLFHIFGSPEFSSLATDRDISDV
jgi:hypothetical protein